MLTGNIFKQLMMDGTNPPTNIQQVSFFQLQRSYGFQDQPGLPGRTLFAIIPELGFGLFFTKSIIGNLTTIARHGTTPFADNDEN